MATAPTETTTKAKRTRKARSAQTARPVYTVLQIVDENGNPVEFDKNRVKLIGYLKSADEVLAVTESDRTKFFLRGMLPVTKKEADGAAS